MATPSTGGGPIVPEDSLTRTDVGRRPPGARQTDDLSGAT